MVLLRLQMLENIWNQISNVGEGYIEVDEELLAVTEAPTGSATEFEGIPASASYTSS